MVKKQPKLILFETASGIMKLRKFDPMKDLHQVAECQKTTKKQRKVANSGGVL